ncbi:MAG TPA: response regulator [Candidatus Wunengus sp. YC60]|uniref:response regulator n=1 Tax=Candidatus Wunengus sp. YC60 TaxID=3367697 RepID=UPI0040283A12
MENNSSKKISSSKLEETLVSTFPRICTDCGKLTNKQFFLTNPVLHSTTLNSFLMNSNSNYVIARFAIEEFYEGEIFFILTVKEAVTIGSLVLTLDDAAVRENAGKGVLDGDCLDAYKEFSNQVCGMLDNELRPKVPKPIHLKLTSTTLINKENINTVLSEETLNEECLILTAAMRILGFDDGQFVLSISKLIGEEFFSEVIEENDKSFKGIILAVDDSNTDLRIIRKFLSSEYKVMVASNPNDALSMLQRSHIDLVLMDIYMPVVDGLTLCERIKRNAMSSNIPIIICSSSPTQTNVIQAIRAGAVDFLVKPFTRQKLIEKINKHFVKDSLILTR